jgi:hypothetical protein
MGKQALEYEFISAGFMLTALVWLKKRWKANLIALDS